MGVLPESSAVRSLPLPEGVDPALWRRLTTELACMLASRNASAAGPELPRPSEVLYDQASHELTWAYELAGDYDQDGEVTLADLVPLAQHFGVKARNENPSYTAFAYYSVEAVIDGDRNGEIGLSDLTVLGQHLGSRVDSYGVYASPDFAQYPLAELGKTYPLTPPAHLSDAFAFGADSNYYELRSMTPARAQPPHTTPWVSSIPAGLNAFTMAERRAGRLVLHKGLAGVDLDGQSIWLRAEGSGLSGGPSLPAMHPLPASAFGDNADYGLSYDPATQNLGWYQTVYGNLDFNKEVNIADLTPVFNHWCEPGPWPLPAANYIRDADRDNLITVRDIRAIGKFFRTFVDTYQVLGTDDPTHLPQAGGGGRWLSSLDANEYTISAGDRRPHYSVDLSGFPEKYVWVQPQSFPGDTRFATPPTGVITRP